jgi:hypothetical protein
MSPELSRLLMIVVGVACLALSRFVPQAQTELLATGIGLLGWAAPAPGHGNGGPKPPSPPAAPTLLSAFAFALVACSGDLPPPCDAATYAGIMARCQVAIRAECPEGTGQCDTRDRCVAELEARKATCLAR